MKILVINAGSSSLKYQLISMTNQTLLAKGQIERIGIEGSNLKHQPHGKDSVIIKKPLKDHREAIKLVTDALIDPLHGVISSMEEIKAVGHRVVHGGEHFNKSVIIDDEVKAAIKQCAELAPLHNTPNLIGIKACEQAMPKVPQVAVFDTSFHQSMPKRAYLYAIPYELYEEQKIRRYGFHGTSHKYVAQRAAKLLNKPLDETNLITIHLGNGSSITAIKDGKSIDTSMGFTPLAGVMMGTRCGDIDPAIVFYLMEKENMTGSEVSDLLNKKSGVLSISGVSSDFRDIDESAEKGNDRAQLALDMFTYQVKKYIGAYAAILGKVDALVFTAGIGENNIKMRRAILDDLDLMGIKINDEKNNIKGIEADISSDDAKIKTLVIPTNEELMIAKETQALVK